MQTELERHTVRSGMGRYSKEVLLFFKVWSDRLYLGSVYPSYDVAGKCCYLSLAPNGTHFATYERNHAVAALVAHYQQQQQTLLDLKHGIAA